MHLRHFLILLLSLFQLSALGQEIAVKTNLAYDAITTLNLGVEVGLHGRNTVNLQYGLNPWNFGKGDNGRRKIMHWVVLPEYRRWFCSRFNGSFIGVHALGGQLNVSNVNIPVPGVFFGGENLRKGVRDHRYEAAFAGAGVTYGYQWILNRHWNFEAEIGAGYIHAWYNKFDCDECGRKVGSGGTNYFGLTKIGLSFLYIF